MAEASSTQFSELTEAEKQSKFRQLAKARGQCVLWRKGEKRRLEFRVLELSSNELRLHLEPDCWPVGTELLGSFDLGTLNFFFKTRLTKLDGEALTIDVSQACFKSERRRNFRLLTYPIYDLSVEITLGEAYGGGNVISLRDRSSQTGLFKSFLKIVDERGEGVTNRFRTRLQDLSLTGFSIHVGEADLALFTAGAELSALTLVFPGEVIEVPAAKVVYVVDHIGHTEKLLKKYKVGVRFASLPESTELRLASKMNELLREIDANRDFEDFIK